MLAQNFRNLMELVERETVSDSFGGPQLQGKAPSYRVSVLTKWLIENYPTESCSTSTLLTNLSQRTNDAEFSYIVESCIRFAFLIELTNLGITSTKMKTRWLEGSIIKTMPGSYQNYRGPFSPGNDERASSFDDCLAVFNRSLELVINSRPHLEVFKNLRYPGCRAVPYEGVLTYSNVLLNPVHVHQNICLTNLNDICWLIQARPIIRAALTSKNRNKINTKCYKTDRSQTGEVQTNRAKRWECIAMDFQHATIEECWSVERKLLSDLAHFTNFSQETKLRLINEGLFGAQHITKCPITLEPLDFIQFQQDAEHGEARFQVGHMNPLKAGGRHVGPNIAWISADGNRIQGDLDLDATRALIRGIAERMNELTL
ncbi:hypothetical protein [Vibrio alginolyticus]|uniref:hypothetical protein n=1 Tax=Vibrio alginolyticus TaxID=663 RepID=UPI00124E3A6D|nr:hypothetical protein [Vibrio alginolyticus]ELN6885661.1 hypothetical protein [Vibrio alginolyticus]KAB2116435.1 hypothetical protein F6475_00870 [Vibrio alginolyticus]MBT0004033.1 hypothetical protein [Vibrio alginolyticus]BCG18875.1 hypothetical protein HLBS07_27270 [Vibrio alginolyticus]